MGKGVESVINIIGVALLLGLVLRYSGEAGSLIKITGDQINSLYSTVSLAGNTGSVGHG